MQRMRPAGPPHGPSSASQRLRPAPSCGPAAVGLIANLLCLSPLSPCAAVGLIVDLLCFCVVSHTYRIKYFVLRNHVVEKVRPVRGGREPSDWWAGCSYWWNIIIKKKTI